MPPNKHTNTHRHTDVLAEQPNGSTPEWQESTRHLLALHDRDYAISSGHQALLIIHANLDRAATVPALYLRLAKPSYPKCLHSNKDLQGGVQRHTILGCQETAPY